MQVFEVDPPSTQIWKREQLSGANIQAPENLRYVSFDFENQTLAEALKTGDLNSHVPTFFTWLGVHMYLTDEAVKATLGVMGAFPKGSELVMDFISPSYVQTGSLVENSVAYLQDVVSKMGEPIKSQYYEADLEDILMTSGFSAVHYLNARWLRDNYLGGVHAAFDLPDDATFILSAVI